MSERWVKATDEFGMEQWINVARLVRIVPHDKPGLTLLLGHLDFVEDTDGMHVKEPAEHFLPRSTLMAAEMLDALLQISGLRKLGDHGAIEIADAMLKRVLTK